ncbi:hypothetical protein [Natrialba chahannaoensis]|nr:hypothetical protein [Natrialba chahannaoensis]
MTVDDLLEEHGLECAGCGDRFPLLWTPVDSDESYCGECIDDDGCVSVDSSETGGNADDV